MSAFSDLSSFTWQELERQGRRMLPSLIGVTAGVVVLLVVIAGTDWLAAVTNRGILDQGGLARITVFSGTAPSFTNEQVRWMRGLDHVADGYGIVSGLFPATLATDGTVFDMHNLPGPVDRPQLLGGAWPGENEVVVPAGVMRSRRTGATIDAFALIGSRVTIVIPIEGGLGTPKTWTVTVTGVYRWSDAQGIEQTVYAPLSTLQAILAAQGSWAGTTDLAGSAGFGTYVIDADSSRNVAAIAARLEARGFHTQYVEQVVRGLSARIVSIQAAAGALVGIIAVFAALTISNTLAQEVRRRRREIAILIAIGFTPRWVAVSLLAQAGIIGVASAVLGFVVAQVVTVVVAATQPGVDMTIGPASVLTVGMAAVAFSVVSASMPCRRAMRLDPVAVLREE